MLIIQGRYVLSCEALRSAGLDLTFWLDHENADVCKARALQRDKALPKDYDPYADANATRLHLFSYMKMNDWAMWREFQHYEYYTPLQRAYARHVADDIAAEATQLLLTNYEEFGLIVSEWDILESLEPVDPATSSTVEAAVPISSARSVGETAAPILTARSVGEAEASSSSTAVAISTARSDTNPWVGIDAATPKVSACSYSDALAFRQPTLR